METPGEGDPSSHDTIPHTVPHPSDGIASPTNSAEDFTQPPVDLSQASDHNTPRGTVQHHDYDHSTVPKQLAQPTDVEESFPQDMMEASVAGAVAPGYTINSNQAPVQIHKQSKCQTYIAETINSSNNFQIDQVHNQVHNEVHNEQHVHQPNITYNTFNTYITGDQEIPFQAVTGVTEPGALSCEEDEAVDNMVTTDSFRRALDILTTGERLLLLSAHPGLTRQSFLSALRRHYRKKGHTVYDLSCVSHWDKKGPAERGSLVIFDCAFGDVRLDREQYHRFYKHSLYSINSLTTKLVFVVYPHVFLELVRYDRVSVRPLLSSMEVVELEQDHTLSIQPYADLFLRMLYDRKHGQMIGALLGLTMKGQGRFLANPAEVVYQLKCLGFPKFPATHLEEYCSLFKGSLLAASDSMFINRVLYDAAGLALGRSYLETVLLQVCDVKFLVQHVRTQHTVTDPSVILISQPGNGRLVIQRMVEELGRGKLPEMVQHPCFHSPKFLQELEAFCGEDQLQLVLDTNDSEHSLSLLYWSVWGPSTHLTEWCLRKMVETGNDRAPQNMIRAAFLTVLMNTVRTTVSGMVSQFRDGLACILHLDFNEKFNLPLPPVQQRYMQELNSLCDNMIEKVKQRCFCYLDNTPMHIPYQMFNVEVKDGTIYVSLSCQYTYLAFRLLTDQHVDEQDREGNTVLHLAAEAGLLEVIKLAVTSGASLTVKNRAGLTPPQLAERRLRQKEDLGDFSKRRDGLIFDACIAGDRFSVKELLCHSATVHTKDIRGFTPLHVAAKCGQTHIAFLLTDLNADLSAPDRLGETPLHHACSRKCLETVKLLVQHGSDVNVQDRYKMTPLHEACAQNDKDSAEVLLRHNADVNLRNSNGHTSLHLACLNSHWDAAQVLLHYHADINGSLHEDDPFTLLHHAIDVGDTKLAEFLLLNNALVDAKISAGSTPLHLACQGRNTDIAQLLLKHGANVNMKTRRGIAPLHFACMAGCTDIVQMLVGNKASVDVKAHKSLTPLHYACIRGHTAIVGLLAINNANVNVKTRSGLTPLHYACMRGHTDIMGLLVSHNANVNVKTRTGLTPLLSACKENKEDIARVLVANRAKVNITHTDNDTPLHYACRGNNADIVRLLLNHGADVNVQNTYGVNALHDACWYADTDVVRLLLGYKDTVSLSDDEGRIPSTVLCEPPAKVDINMTDNQGWTALHRACIAGRTETVRLLLQQDDIDVNVIGSYFFSWVDLNGFMDIAQLLLLHNVDVNVPDSRGRTPLHWACMFGHLDVVHLLLQHGAHTNISDGDGETLLLQACTHGHQDIVQYVLQHNADMNKETRVLHDALNTAQWNGHLEIVQLLQQNMSCLNVNLSATDMLGKTPLHLACSRKCLETVTRLAQHGSDVNAQDRYKMTPLHEACAQNDKDSAEVLLRHNADVNLRNSIGHTPLHLACLNSHWDAAQVLLHYHADINGSLNEDDLFTLLHHAIDVGHTELAEFLLLHNALADAKTSVGSTPLHLACQGRHTDIAQLLLKHGANVNMKTRRGIAPLHYACMAGCTDIVRMLVNNKANVDVKTNKMLTPLHYACIKGNTDIVGLLAINNANVNVKSRSGMAPLHYACIRGHSDIMGLLVSHNANVNVKTRTGLTPLHYACQENKADIARLLVANRADVNFTNTDNDTPLHYACYVNNTDTVRLLLNHGAHVNVQNTDGYTALHDACWGGYTDVVSLLLGYKDTVSLSDDEGRIPSTVLCEPLTKVDINMTDNEGRTALFWACEAGNTEIVQLLLQQDDIDVNAAGDDCISPLLRVCIVGITDIAQLLLLHNADVNMSDSIGRTPLHFAGMYGHRDVVHLLLQHGADVNISDTRGMTALYSACVVNQHKIVHLLLQHGADVNIPDTRGMTALYSACEDYHRKIVHLLLQHGANVNISDEVGETLLLQACTHGHQDIVRLVLQHNADMNKERSALYTALNAAQRKGHREIVQLVQQYKSPSHPYTYSVAQQPSLQLSAQ